jgi:hypothetical protein
MVSKESIKARKRRLAEARNKRRHAEATDPRAFIRMLVNGMKRQDLELRLAIAVQAVHLLDAPTRAMVERDFAPFAKLLGTLVERSRSQLKGSE